MLRTILFAVVSTVLTLIVTASCAYAQLALLDSEPAETYGLTVISGSLSPSSLSSGKLALVFIVPGDCPACELLLERASAWSTDAFEVVLVVNSTADVSASWFDRNQDWNIWRDSRDVLGHLLAVSEAPTVFMVDSGAVVNADYWPFYDGLDGLDREITNFALAPSRPSSDEISAALSTVKLDEIKAIGTDGEPVVLSNLTTPGLLVVCTPGCAVCGEQAEYLRDLRVQYPGLPPVTFLVVADDTEDSRSLETLVGSDYELLWLPRDFAGALDTGISPTNLFLDEKGTVAWSSLGYSETIGNRLLAEVRE